MITLDEFDWVGNDAQDGVWAQHHMMFDFSGYGSSYYNDPSDKDCRQEEMYHGRLHGEDGRCQRKIRSWV